MPLIDRVSRPSIEAIVKKHTGLKLFEIIPIHTRKPKRRGKEPRGLRRQIVPVGVGSPHDQSKPLQRLCDQREFFDHDIEATAFSAMAPKHAFDIKGRCLESVRDMQDLSG